MHHPNPITLLLATLALLVGGLPAAYGFMTPTVPLSAARSLSKLPTTPMAAPFSSTTQSTSLSSVLSKKAAVVTARRTPGAFVLRGKLSAVVGKFLISPQRAAQVFLAIGQHVMDDVWDLVLIVMLLKAPIPLAKFLYRKRHATKEWSDAMAKKFDASKTRRVAKLILEIGELLGLIWATEIGILLLKELGFQFVHLYPINQWMAGIVFSLWGAQNASAAKYYLLSRGQKLDLSKSGGPRLLNRFFDILIYAGTLLAILDFLSVETGLALRSLFGLSSVGTLVFSLASKELVAEFLASLAIQGTNMYQEGDGILLQDGC